MPPIQASAPASECGVPVSASERAALAVSVTGLTLAIVWSQSGNVATGTKTELANTSGNVTTKPADSAASGPRRVSPTYAKIQLSPRPKAGTIGTQPIAPDRPPVKRKPTR